MLRFASKRRLADLSPEEQEVFQQPWTYNYRTLDLETGPQPEMNERSQAATQEFVFRHIRDSILRCKGKPQGISVSCGDGFYGIYALSRGAEKIRICDVGAHRTDYRPWNIEQSKLAAKLLGVEEKCSFSSLDFSAMEGHYDFAIAADLLIHFPDPQAVLLKLRQMVRGPLVVFTTTIYRGNPVVLEVPASGRPWGSAFTHDKAIMMAVDAGWTVVNEQFKQMPEGWVGERNFTGLLCV